MVEEDRFNVCVVCGCREFSAFEPIRGWVCGECQEEACVDWDLMEWGY